MKRPANPNHWMLQAPEEGSEGHDVRLLFQVSQCDGVPVAGHAFIQDGYPFEDPSNNRYDVKKAKLDWMKVYDKLVKQGWTPVAI